MSKFANADAGSQGVCANEIEIISVEIRDRVSIFIIRIYNNSGKIVSRNII
jgi:hypothetical protein